MSNDFSAVHHVALQPDTTFERPPELPRLVHLDDPALWVMTDFKHVRPLTITPDVPIDAALETMKKMGVRLLLVAGEDEIVNGIVTSYDIQGEAPIRLSQETRVPRSAINVEAIMTPLAKIRVLNMLSLETSQVGHVVATLRQLELRHVLVVDTEAKTRKHTVRGLFSATQISRQLGVDITEVMVAAHSLAEMQHEKTAGKDASLSG